MGWEGLALRGGGQRSLPGVQLMGQLTWTGKFGLGKESTPSKTGRSHARFSPSSAARSAVSFEEHPAEPHLITSSLPLQGLC